MTVAGYDEVYKHAFGIRFNQTLAARSSNAPGFLLLKLFTWKDRHHQHQTRGKDAADIAYILRNAEHIVGIEPLYEEYPDLVVAANYDLEIAAAAALGERVRKMAQPDTVKRLKAIRASHEDALLREVAKHLPQGTTGADQLLSALWQEIVNPCEGRT